MFSLYTSPIHVQCGAVQCAASFVSITEKAHFVLFVLFQLSSMPWALRGIRRSLDSNSISKLYNSKNKKGTNYMWHNINTCQSCLLNFGPNEWLSPFCTALTSFLLLLLRIWLIYLVYMLFECVSLQTTQTVIYKFKNGFTNATFAPFLAPFACACIMRPCHSAHNYVPLGIFHHPTWILWCHRISSFLKYFYRKFESGSLVTHRYTCKLVVRC